MANQEQNQDTTKPKITRETFRKSLTIFKFIRPYSWYMIFGLLALLLSSVSTLVLPALSGQMVDISMGTSEYNWTLKDIGKLLIILFAVQGVTSYVRVLLFSYVSEKGIADVRKAVYQKLIGLPIVFFEENQSGELISRLSSDVGKLYNVFSSILAEFIRQFFTLIISVVLLLIRARELSLIMFAIFPAVIIAAMIFGRYIRQLSKTRQEELAKSNTILSESIQAIQAVKTFTNELFEYRRYGKSIDTVVTVSMKYAHARALFALVIIVLFFGSIFFILWQGALMVENGTMTVGRLIEFLFYMIFIGASIGSLGNFYTEILGALGATERIREILVEKNEVEVQETTTVAPVKLSGKIQYKNVMFNYPTRKNVPVLKNISFEVQNGQKVALVGASGSGKSTIVQLLMRFYDIDKGNIFVDGKDIKDYDIQAFRNNIAIVPQEVILFGGSIEENIRYGKPEASTAEIIAAAKKANAWEFIHTFPEGLQTIVGERGVKLSGGQRQRIAIARAILKDPAILLLDEATSALDAESERLVQDALNVLMEGRTSIIIAHRLSTIRDADRIYVLENGEIVESGNHSELSILENGVYNNLAKLQFEVV
jgi:ABC transporter fused permease/ATP-binding protein